MTPLVLGKTPTDEATEIKMDEDTVTGHRNTCPASRKPQEANSVPRQVVVAHSSELMPFLVERDAPWEGMVQLERDRQSVKYGDKPRTLERLFTILGEEQGELARAILNRGNVTEELVHVAAVCKLIYETGRDFGYTTEKGPAGSKNV